MASNSWCRPSSLPYPFVWADFNKTDHTGTLLQFEIKDLTEDLFPACIEFMNKYFIPDEPLFNCLGMVSDPASVKDLIDAWKDVLSDNCSLVCTLKRPDSNETEIIGIYILYHHHKMHDTEDYKYTGEKYKALCNIATFVEQQTDRYKLFEIEEYLDEFGLCVHPNYRCMGIATELLMARIKLGEALRLKVSFTMCTAIASQKACDKVGYQNLFEIDFHDLEKEFPEFKLNVKDTPTLRYMYIQHST